MKKSMIVLLALFALIPASRAGTLNCDKEESYPVISKADLKKAADLKSAFIVDVNSTESFKEAHVPGAVRYGDHDKDFAKLLPTDKSKMIVAYCGGPSCNAWLKAAKEACGLGYTNIHHFKEGISGWKKM
jgi:rhodanese-related sulfurtransferase